MPLNSSLRGLVNIPLLLVKAPQDLPLFGVYVWVHTCVYMRVFSPCGV